MWDNGKVKRLKLVGGILFNSWKMDVFFFVLFCFLFCFLIGNDSYENEIQSKHF